MTLPVITLGQVLGRVPAVQVFYRYHPALSRAFLGGIVGAGHWLVVAALSFALGLAIERWKPKAAQKANYTFWVALFLEAVHVLFFIFLFPITNFDL